MNQLAQNISLAWNLSAVSDAERATSLDRIGRLVYQAVLVRSLDILSDDDQSAFDQLLDQDQTTPDDVIRFLRAKIPTFDLLLKEEINSLRSELGL